MEQTNHKELILKIDELKNSLVKMKNSVEAQNDTSINLEKLDNVITKLDNMAEESINFQKDELKDSLLGVFDSIKDLFSI